MRFVGPTGRVPFIAAMLRRLNLRFPALFTALVILTALDLVVPDLIPLVDEIGLALLLVLVGRWKDRRNGPVGPSSGEATSPRRGPRVEGRRESGVSFRGLWRRGVRA
jgi:Family of unknown function (DUF6116)